MNLHRGQVIMDGGGGGGIYCLKYWKTTPINYYSLFAKAGMEIIV